MIRLHHLAIFALLLFTSCNKDDIIPTSNNTNYDWIPVDRTTAGIVLDKQDELSYENTTYKTDFYRNLSYNAGLQGNYTFLVLNPANDPEGEAPLWVYFHGGGVGYFNDEGIYQCLKFQDSLSWNKEETYDQFVNVILENRLFDNGVLMDNTLSRRINEGYRVLVVSYSDHDFYAGMGTEYTNNPIGGQVNGLQASMSAVDFVTTNYPTSYVYTHGTSAGGYGAYIMGVAYYLEGTRLNGIVSDSGPLLAETSEIYAEYQDHPDNYHMPTFESEGVIEKVGVFTDVDEKLYAEAMVANGFDVPLLGIAGRVDPFYNCQLPVMSKAVADGYDNNVDWLFRNLIAEIDQQTNSLHRILLLDNTGHVPTIKSDPIASNVVDDFISNILSTNPDIPFNE